MEEKVGVIGLGYVGLPLAIALAREFPGTVGFDIAADKIAVIQKGQDPNSEGLESELKSTSLKVSSDPEILRSCTFLIVGVPTPVDEYNRPDIRPLEGACRTLGKVISKGALVVFESTVYPGLTEEICGVIIEQTSGLRRGKDFKLGYSPERMNPGDREHTVDKIVKVVSAEDPESEKRVVNVYGRVVKAGIHLAPSIRVAEAAKVIENTQRDLNIALMNELAMLFDRMGLRTKDVLDAAATKWNFLKFSPGLVGGHCIGVDPYYLTTKAEQLGYHPQVILAGRRINDGMSVFIAQRLVKEMVNAGIQMKGARVGILGITFKENVSDVRNSRVPSIVHELNAFGVEVFVHDPMVSPEAAHEEYGLKLCSMSELNNLDGLVFAVMHRQYLELPLEKMSAMLRPGAVFVDVKSVIDRSKLRPDITYWSL